MLQEGGIRTQGGRFLLSKKSVKSEAKIGNFRGILLKGQGHGEGGVSPRGAESACFAAKGAKNPGAEGGVTQKFRDNQAMALPAGGHEKALACVELCQMGKKGQIPTLLNYAVLGQ